MRHVHGAPLKPPRACDLCATNVSTCFINAKSPVVPVASAAYHPLTHSVHINGECTENTGAIAHNTAPLLVSVHGRPPGRYDELTRATDTAMGVEGMYIKPNELRRWDSGPLCPHPSPFDHMSDSDDSDEEGALDTEIIGGDGDAAPSRRRAPPAATPSPEASPTLNVTKKRRTSVEIIGAT